MNEPIVSPPSPAQRRPPSLPPPLAQSQQQQRQQKPPQPPPPPPPSSPSSSSTRSVTSDANFSRPSTKRPRSSSRRVRFDRTTIERDHCREINEILGLRRPLVPRRASAPTSVLHLSRPILPSDIGLESEALPPADEVGQTSTSVSVLHFEMGFFA
mmetsp:Transcript_7268/g.18377  ORF Transcript_7268/g.18377 Transcript_7268/m.18377 type:complete len:156 (+) Transcript_7268:48-515(+)